MEGGWKRKDERDKKGWKVDGKGKVKGIKRGGRWMER